MGSVAAAGAFVFLAVGLGAAANGVIWWGLSRGWPARACVLAGTAALTTLVALLAVAAGAAVHQNLLVLWQKEFAASLDASLAVYRRLGWSDAELARAAWLLRTVMIDALFGWLVVAAAGFSFLSYRLQRVLAPDLAGSALPLAPFPLWRVPDTWIFGLLAGMILVLWGHRAGGETTRLAGINILVVMANVYVVSGLSVTRFYMERWRLPSILQMLIVLALGMLPAGLSALGGLGVLDTWMNWRRFAAKAE